MNVGKIVAYDSIKSLISIKSSMHNVRLGDSICCSGVCLTIMNIKDQIIDFNISSSETKKNKFNAFEYWRFYKFRKISKSWRRDKRSFCLWSC